MRFVAAPALAVVLMLLAAAGAHAQAVGLHLASHHWPDEGQNNANVGAYYRNADGYVLGGYWNSERNLSGYVAREWEWQHVGLRLGLGTGYDRSAVSIVGAVLVPLDKGFKLALVPPLFGGPAVAHLVWERKQ